MNIRTKSSDYIAMFLREQGINHVFIVSGGASIHILHSLAEMEGISPVAVHHEQAAGMAADGYARARFSLGAAVATSGPGATNLLTAIAGAWFDSIPVLFITGQVSTAKMRRNLNVRQLGFQETDIVSMAAPITKSALQVNSINDLHSALHSLTELALTGRPGPVLIDIPDDIQRSIGEFPLPVKVKRKPEYPSETSSKYSFGEIENLIRKSSRPVLILGAGANGFNTREISKEIVETLKIPTLLTWRAKDLISQDSNYLVGTFGSHGTRWGNFAVQNADLVLAFGTRLSTRETGGDLKTWARMAELVHVDIDDAESEKLSALGKSPKLTIKADLEEFLPNFLQFTRSNLSDYSSNDWMEWIKVRKQRYSYKLSNISSQISGYDFYAVLNTFLKQNEQIFVDTGCTVAWAMQRLELPDSITLHHDCNNTAMGWALPAAIGGALAQPSLNTTCIVGDGSMMMNIQELSTVFSAGTKLFVILLNNLGYGMVRQTEQQWLDSIHIGTDARKGDLIFPNFVALAKAFGFNAVRAQTQSELIESMTQMYVNNTINFLEVMIDPGSKVIPQARFGFPLEDSEPSLSKSELQDNMIIPVL